ncbi:branched-chain amino acid ABC transporter substrate-binding protein [Thauera sp. 2A1]|uniref:branched-chain amino acid ABC transporter substrate-binding protein n=1 Tax=Thauera sp. 2A1 TaxID=2570191 RepID=UPI0012916B8C|nr:branched-chain amino acid ABC transporter substrate-binding protein [Thauera sp. 2A1]KAI5915361.1 branched-chain amino acid ABC transporter substrate-binding protein [Thauera sp. 2A1]
MKKTVVAFAIMSIGLGAAQAQEVVKLGSAAPLTGTIAHLGKDLENGTRMAVEALNAQGVTIGGKKVKFELIGEDDQADPRTGTTVAQRLVDAGVKGVIGHLNSGTSIPASRIYDQGGIPQISPASTNPKLTQQNFKGVFRTIANDVQQGGALGKFAVKSLGAKKVAIIDDRTAYGQGLADETEKAVKASGAQVVAREFTTDKATDFNAILTKIRATAPDVIFFGGMDAQAGPMLRQMKQLGINAKFLTGDGGCSPEMIKLAGEAMSASTYCSMAGLPLDKMPGGAAFREQYKKRFGGEVQLYAPYAYDAATAIVKAMEKAGSPEPSKYLPELKKINFNGVTGNVAFDDKGDIKEGAVTIYSFKDGNWVPM